MNKDRIKWLFWQIFHTVRGVKSFFFQSLRLIFSLYISKNLFVWKFLWNYFSLFEPFISLKGIILSLVRPYSYSWFCSSGESNRRGLFLENEKWTQDHTPHSYYDIIYMLLCMFCNGLYEAFQYHQDSSPIFFFSILDD